MRPIYIPDFVPSNGVFETLANEVSWDTRAGNRKESFMAIDTALRYSYGKSDAVRRTYEASELHPYVRSLLHVLNYRMKSEYNICVLNYYENQHNSLDWHADDSPEQDPNHPIAVISFGASRYIYIKENDYKGKVPEEDMFLLTPGSLFVMPAGFQDTHKHKIPKHDRECGGRISLTYRKLDR